MTVRIRGTVRTMTGAARRGVSIGWLCATIVASPLGCGDDEAGGGGEGTTGGGTASVATSGEPEPSTGAVTPGATATGSSSGQDGTTGPTSDTGDSSDAGSTGTTGAVDPVWQDFLEDRVTMLEALAVPIVDCVDNVDTGHPAFHGCIDWHSAVHATYSLHLLYRATGDEAYRDLADETLEANAVAGELQDVQTQQIDWEIPYGYAWFLALAVERERATGQTDLNELGVEVAEQLRNWIATRSENQLANAVLADDYGNLSWAVLNLWHWAQWTGDAALADEMQAVVDDVLLDPMFDEWCPLDQEQTDIDDFFPPCLHRTMAIVTIADPADAQAWLRGYLPADFVLQPLFAGDITAAHQSGLNFSRAWGLYALWKATDDPSFRDQYIDHVRTHVDQPQYWAENYSAFSHWVAQFGVYAIGLTYTE